MAVEQADHDAGENAERGGYEGAHSGADEACHQDGGEGVNGADGEIEFARNHQHTGAERQAAEHGDSLHQDRQVLRREVAELIGIEQGACDADDLQRHEDEEDRACRHRHDLPDHRLFLRPRPGRGTCLKNWCHGLVLDRLETENLPTSPAGSHETRLAEAADQRLDRADARLVEEGALAGVDVGRGQSVLLRERDLGDRVVALEIGLLVHGREHRA